MVVGMLVTGQYDIFLCMSVSVCGRNLVYFGLAGRLAKDLERLAARCIRLAV